MAKENESQWHPIFPTEKDFWDISKSFPGDKIRSNLFDIDVNVSGLEWFIKGKNIEKWRNSINSKILHIEISYISALYCKNKGIPDDEWYKSSDSGAIEYRPNMNNNHWDNKIMFDYYIDTCFYSIWSAFDLIGQLLNEKYDLGLNTNKLYFSTILSSSKLKERNLPLYENLNEITKDKKYRSAKLRHSFAHRISPTELIAPYIKTDGKTSSLQIGEYITTREIWHLTEEALDSLNSTLEIIRNHQ